MYLASREDKLCLHYSVNPAVPVLKPPWTAYGAVIGCFIARAITQQGMQVIG